MSAAARRSSKVTEVIVELRANASLATRTTSLGTTMFGVWMEPGHLYKQRFIVVVKYAVRNPEVQGFAFHYKPCNARKGCEHAFVDIHKVGAKLYFAYLPDLCIASMPFTSNAPDLMAITGNPS